MMSLYGGLVSSGSVVAVLQSIGAAGMGPVATAIVGTIGGILGGSVEEALRKHNHEDLVKGLTVCLLSPCGGKLDEETVAALLMVFRSHGIKGVRNKTEKAGLERCLKVMAS